ncbi:MAG: hypothetical protein HFG39_14985 [Lachnospiraceae bacterium]|nr:hypothetical protein [Lachnospiraceae bacterium]
MRALQVNENVSMNEVLVLSELQAKTRYNIGRSRLLDVANEAGAVVRLGSRKNGYLREVLDDYFRRMAE